MKRAGLIVLLLLYPARIACGQDVDGPPEFLTAVPESPAFTILSASPSNVTRPGAVRDLGLALLDGIGDDGKVVQGFSLEASPWVLPGFTVSMNEYQDSWAKFVGSNLQLSLGTVRSAGDTSSTDIALGARATLIDRGDVVRNRTIADSIGSRILRDCAPAMPGDPSDPGCIGRIIEQARGEHWNAFRVSIAAASALRLQNSISTDNEVVGASAWLVAALPVTDRGQLITQLAVAHRSAAGDGYYDLSSGARLVVGSSSFNLFLEVVGALRRGLSEPSNDARTFWSFGAEARIAKDLWASTGFGERFSAFDGADRVVVMGNLRWAIARSSRLGGFSGGR